MGLTVPSLPPKFYGCSNHPTGADPIITCGICRPLHGNSRFHGQGAATTS